MIKINKRNIVILILAVLLVVTIVFASSYVPQLYSSVDFTLDDGYTAPIYSLVNFTLADTEVTSCAVYITLSKQWYVPTGCTCYIETQETEMYLNLDSFVCTNG